MRKIITLGIMLLFLGMTISSSTGVYLEKQSIKPLSFGNILYVGGNGTGNYTKIQDAIDDASDGDTVFVYNGTYYEYLGIGKSINLIGENRNITIIDGNDLFDVVEIYNDWVNISGFTIRNSGTHSALYAGIEIFRSDNCKIIGNNILENQAGIELYLSNNNTFISNNITLNKDYGIYSWDGCHNTIKNNNIISNKQTGMLLAGDNGNYNIIIGNNITSNKEGGIAIAGESGYNIISNNTVFYNNPYGVLLFYSNPNNTITGNNISNNGVGIEISEYSRNNIIYHNNLINNSLNARDKGSNSWDDGYPSGGNYWDDYTGNDSNWDRIGDTPYPIPGGNNEDRYPLMEPYGSYPSTIVGTYGPLCPLLNIAEITLIDGNESQIQKIERILNSRILQFVHSFTMINVTGLNFSVSYNRNIPSIWFFYKRLWYTTIIDENRNVTFYNCTHRVTVEGLVGTFYFFRGQFFNLFPPHFLFAGYCQNVTIDYSKGV